MLVIVDNSVDLTCKVIIKLQEQTDFWDNQQNIVTNGTLSQSFPLFHHIVDADIEQRHLPEQLRQPLPHKLFLTGLEDLFLRPFRHEVAQTTLVVDNLLAGQLLVSLYCRIRIHLQQHGILTD